MVLIDAGFLEFSSLSFINQRACSVFDRPKIEIFNRCSEGELNPAIVASNGVIFCSDFVISEILKRLWRDTVTAIRRLDRNVDLNSIRKVITVPAVANFNFFQLIQRSAEVAELTELDLNGFSFRNDFLIVTQPVAAALSTLISSSNRFIFANVRSVLLVCITGVVFNDIGILRNFGDGSFDEFLPPSRSHDGSAGIDELFKNEFINLVGNFIFNDGQMKPLWEDLLNQFIRSKQSRIITSFPYYFNISMIVDFINENFQLNFADLLRIYRSNPVNFNRLDFDPASVSLILPDTLMIEWFDLVSDRIGDRIFHSINSIVQKGEQCSAIFLAGHFSMSSIFRERIEARFNLIPVVYRHRSDDVVVDGAALLSLNPYFYRLRR